MAVSISHLGYTKLSQAIFEWQAADKTSLLALFMVMEVSLHWLWCLFGGAAMFMTPMSI